jgi:protein TonB
MSRRLQIAALISTAAHLVVLGGVLIAGRRFTPPDPGADKPAAVELVMIEQKGAGQPTAPAAPGEPAAGTRATRDRLPLPSLPQPETTRPIVAPPSPPPFERGELAPAPALPAGSPPRPPSPPTGAATSEPAAQPSVRAPAAPEFNIGGTDSESNAIASGDRIVPASPDNKFRNRPPIYPEEAARRGEQGSVILVIHVSPMGLTSGVDVLQSSGHTALDRAAREAVLAWRFLPAVRDGEPIPFDMPMRFIFENN